MLVFDASAAVKWFRDEVDSDAARDLLGSEEARDGVCLPDNCLHEVIAVVCRSQGEEVAVAAWEAMVEAGVAVAHVDGSLVSEALAAKKDLSCSYYDALAPAVARVLGATLVSADRKAHATLPGVLLLGE